VNDFVLLAAGFLLTTVAGGLLGYWLQDRAWHHQEQSRRREAQLDAARAYYEELSRLLDRRLHRMRQLDGRLDRPDQDDDVAVLLERYRQVLDDWNDNLNRNLALGMSYFGPETHRALETLYTDFSAAGSRIEVRVREYREAGVASSPPVQADLRGLDLAIYDLNVQLIAALQREAVGLRDDEPPRLSRRPRT
jgi:hypothetical protein